MILMKKNRIDEADTITRIIIAHGHIFKNAGTTFDYSLERNFGKRFVDHRDDAPMRKKGSKYLKNYLKENKHLQAISSHHMCYPFPNLPETKIIPAYFFRHPIERIRSVYNFERKQKSGTPGAINAKKNLLKNMYYGECSPKLTLQFAIFTHGIARGL